jgi:hypothetical protein
VPHVGHRNVALYFSVPATGTNARKTISTAQRSHSTFGALSIKREKSFSRLMIVPDVEVTFQNVALDRDVSAFFGALTLSSFSF